MTISIRLQDIIKSLEYITKEYNYHFISPPKCLKFRLNILDLEWLDKHGLLKYIDCFIGKEPELEVITCPIYAYPVPPFCSKVCTCPDNSIHMKDNVCRERCIITGDWFVLVRGTKHLEE